MKTFFVRFFCFISVFLSVWAVQAEMPAPKEASKEHQKMIAFMKYIESAKQKAQNQSPNQASLFENADQYNLLSPFYLMQTDASPFSGTNGYGAWTSLPFGQARLISCASGIKGEKGVFAGLQVKLKDGVLLKKPLLSSSLPPEAHVQFLYPIQYPLPPHKTKTETYTGLLIFPILADVTNPNEPFELTATATLTGCTENECQTVTKPLSLTLTHTEQFPTGICPLIVDFLQDVPVPAKGRVRARAHQDAKGNFQLVLKFTQPTSLVSVQIDNDFSFKEKSKRITKENAFLTLHPDKPLLVGTVLNLKVITSNGRFDVPTVLTQGEMEYPIADFPWEPIIFGGLGLLFLTPFWMLFWLQKPKNKKTLKSEAQQMLIVTGILTFCVAGLWQVGLLIPIDFIQTSFICVLVSFAALVYLIYRPQVSLLGALVLFWVIPKPYLANTFVPQISEPFFMVCWWGVVMMTPFILIYKYPQIALKLFQFLAKTPRQVGWIARAPFVLLLGWLLVASIGNAWVNRSLPLYTPQALEQALKGDKIALVSVEPPVCFTCVWNKAVQMKTGYARQYDRHGYLVRFYLPIHSVAGQVLQGQSGTTDLPLNLFYGPNNKNGVVLPAAIDYFKLKEYLNAVL